MSDILFASLLQFPTEIYRSADLFCVRGDLERMGSPMKLRNILRESPKCRATLGAVLGALRLEAGEHLSLCQKNSRTPV